MKFQRINGGIIGDNECIKSEHTRIWTWKMLFIPSFKLIFVSEYALWMEEKGLLSWYIKTEDQIGQMVIMFAFL